MNTTKEQLVNTVKEWITIDQQMSVLQREIKQRRNRKKELTSILVEIMKTNEIDCFDINDGKIIYTQNKVRSPINKKHILECLSKYFGDNTDIHIDDITQFILDNREMKTKENIRLKQTNN
jgi:hypothetical protein